MDRGGPTFASQQYEYFPRVAFQVSIDNVVSNLREEGGACNEAALFAEGVPQEESSSWETIMTSYSFFFIDTDEHIGMSAQIECLTDEQAMEVAAQEAGDYRAIQIWDGERPIAMIGNPRNRVKKLVGSVPFVSSAAGAADI
jgi:hypothetical protein